MHDKLRGQWYGPRETVARSLGHSHVLPPALRTPEGAFSVLNRLTQKAAMRLRKQEFYATAMSVHVRCAHLHRGEPSGALDTRFGESQDTAFFLHVLQTLWARGLNRLESPKAVGMTLHGLVPAAQHTPGLFDTPTDSATAPVAPPPSAARPPHARVAAPAALRDRSKLFTAMDAVNRTHGKNAIYFATAHDVLDHAPMRIAFNRIPDIETER
jgi:DNA polymerase-4